MAAFSLNGSIHWELPSCPFIYSPNINGTMLSSIQHPSMSSSDLKSSLEILKGSKPSWVQMINNWCLFFSESTADWSWFCGWMGSSFIRFMVVAFSSRNSDARFGIESEWSDTIFCRINKLCTEICNLFQDGALNAHLCPLFQNLEVFHWSYWGGTRRGGGGGGGRKRPI